MRADHVTCARLTEILPIEDSKLIASSAQLGALYLLGFAKVRKQRLKTTLAVTVVPRLSRHFELCGLPRCSALLLQLGFVKGRKQCLKTSLAVTVRATLSKHFAIRRFAKWGFRSCCALNREDVQYEAIQ